MRGPIVRLLEAAFYENFIEAHGAGRARARRPRAAEPTTKAPSMLVRSSPTGGSNDLKRLYLLAIASARRTLDITTPYFVTDESTMWALEDAVRRGVRVRVLVEGDITDAKPVKYASRDALRPADVERHRDLRVSADDDARQDDGRRRRPGASSGRPTSTTGRSS